jgi:hypothetical protein
MEHLEYYAFHALVQKFLHLLFGLLVKNSLQTRSLENASSLMIFLIIIDRTTSSHRLAGIFFLRVERVFSNDFHTYRSDFVFS